MLHIRLVSAAAIRALLGLQLTLELSTRVRLEQTGQQLRGE
jgi:hypothetical protein